MCTAVALEVPSRQAVLRGDIISKLAEEAEVLL